MRLAFRHLMFLFCLLASVSFSSSTPAAVSSKQALQTIMHDGKERSYLIRSEHITRDKKSVPLVIVLHGGGGNGEITERMTGFTRKAIKEKFIVVYPNGSNRFGDKLRTWNAGNCCGYAMDKRIDDVGFIKAMLDKLISEYPVDPKRIYVTGLSNGGMMTHRLGMELSDKITAIAPVIAGLFGDEKSSAGPVSALMINGMLDESVPYLGGAPGGRFAKEWSGKPILPAEAQTSFWARANGCSATPETHDSGEILHWKYACPSHDVELYLVKDNGHSWPGGQPGTRRADTPSQAMNATDVIWAFFKTKSR